jgi:hypothetical protein
MRSLDRSSPLVDSVNLCSFVHIESAERSDPRGCLHRDCLLDREREPTLRCAALPEGVGVMSIVNLLVLLSVPAAALILGFGALHFAKRANER